jgi:arginine repressor
METRTARHAIIVSILSERTVGTQAKLVRPRRCGSCGVA